MTNKNGGKEENMKKLFKILLVFLMVFGIVLPSSVSAEEANQEYRLQYHFSNEKGWSNDPNGMVYYKGQWHLFFQYYPDGVNHGPMSWGHAVSSDLVNWTEYDIPDVFMQVYIHKKMVQEGIFLVVLFGIKIIHQVILMVLKVVV